MAKKKAQDIEATLDAMTTSGATIARVSWGSNTRDYTKAIHGDTFADLAQEFATKRNGTLELL